MWGICFKFVIWVASRGPVFMGVTSGSHYIILIFGNFVQVLMGTVKAFIDYLFSLY